MTTPADLWLAYVTDPTTNRLLAWYCAVVALAQQGRQE